MVASNTLASLQEIVSENEANFKLVASLLLSSSTVATAPLTTASQPPTSVNNTVTYAVVALAVMLSLVGVVAAIKVMIFAFYKTK